MGTLRDELVRNGLARKEDYVPELQFWDAKPEHRASLMRIAELNKRLNGLRDKMPLLTPDEHLKLFLLGFVPPLQAREKLLEELCLILEQK